MYHTLLESSCYCPLCGIIGFIIFSHEEKDTLRVVLMRGYKNGAYTPVFTIPSAPGHAIIMAVGP
jgi:hypothetical protein